ncbi:MAG: LamG domain-containing protein, partial [Candidatus Gracilibacteria bacterium]
SFIPEANASVTSDYSKRFPVTQGDSLGILLGNSGGSLNQPVQELYNASSFTGVDVVNTNSGYLAYFSNKITISGTGIKLISIKANYTQKNDPMIYDSSLVGYYDMETLTPDNKLADLSGNGNSLDNSGGLLVGESFGKINNAILFDGTSKYFYSFSPVFNLTSNITVSSWVKTNTGGNIVTKTTNWNQGFALQRVFNSFDWFYFVTGSGNTFKATNSNIKSALNDTWQFIIGVHKDDINLIYINGKLEKTLTGVTNVITSSTGSMNIGSIGNGIHNFNGLIDEVRIYNRALSDSEIQALYNATK